MTGASLREKTKKYERMLSEAVEHTEIKTKDENAEEFRVMAESYLSDGRHFKNEDDYVNALAAFSYGHAWLDAGMRMDFYETDRYDLFTVEEEK
ncbi:MAG: DUF357 domain-containing protein [Halobacteria archaeon]